MQGEAATIARFQKNERDHIRIELSEFKGYKLLNARVWTKSQTGDEVPTKSGFSVRVELADQLVAGLQSALAEARSRGWV